MNEMEKYHEQYRSALARVGVDVVLLDLSPSMGAPADGGETRRSASVKAVAKMSGTRIMPFGDDLRPDERKLCKGAGGPLRSEYGTIMLRTPLCAAFEAAKDESPRSVTVL